MPDPSGRADPRIDFQVAVKVQHLSLLQQFYSKNLSRSGIFLQVPGKPPPIGAKLRLQFSIPDLKKTVTVDAEVIHQHTFQTLDENLRKKVAKHGVGLRFLNLNPEDQELILKYVTGRELSVRK